MKPRSGIFCCRINEVRQTSALELPDCENAFVIKVRERRSIKSYDGMEICMSDKFRLIIISTGSYCHIILCIGKI